MNEIFSTLLSRGELEIRGAEQIFVSLYALNIILFYTLMSQIFYYATKSRDPTLEGSVRQEQYS